MDNQLIVYEDNNIIICNKPVGMASQPERGFEMDLESYILNYRTSHNEPAYAAIINRLDKPVGGLVLFAKNKHAAGKLSALSKAHGIEKYYYALAEGIIDEKGGITDYIMKEPGKNISHIVTPDTRGAKKAVLFYEKIGIKEIGKITYSLLRIKLVTGRHHQIRLQMAHMGHPLYGDTKYNTGFYGRRDVCPALYAYRISFNNPSGVDRITVETEPDDRIFCITQE